MTTENRADPNAPTPVTVAPPSAAVNADGSPRPAPDFPWMRVPTQRGMKPKPGPEGLRLELVDVGDYGYVPDHWPYKNDLPRGAFPAPNQDAIPHASYSLYEKTDVWAENVRVLYEDAIRDRWASALDIPWETLEPNPEIVERAICQICTYMSEQAYLTMQVLSAWLEKISYGFHEVKNYLATQVYDNARHVEAFRKRALANGGGLGVEGTGIYNKVVASGLRFSEFIVSANIVRGAFNLVLMETLLDTATTEAERRLYDYTARDIRRHLAYGVEHIAFVISRQPEMLAQVHTWLSRAEMFLAADQRRDSPFTEALIILLGNNAEEGRAKLDEVRRTWLAFYLNRLADARVFDRTEKLNPALKAMLPEGAHNPESVLMRPMLPDPAL